MADILTKKSHHRSIFTTYQHPKVYLVSKGYSRCFLRFVFAVAIPDNSIAKRDLLFLKRDLLFLKRDLLFFKRDLINTVAIPDNSIAVIPPTPPTAPSTPLLLTPPLRRRGAAARAESAARGLILKSQHPRICTI
jgi:hypothetical protein